MPPPAAKELVADLGEEPGGSNQAISELML